MPVENIPADFKPEATFAILLHNANEAGDGTHDSSALERHVLATRNEWELQGIPESALNE